MSYHNKRHYRMKHHKKYRPFGTKIIRTKQIAVDLFKVILFLIVAYGAFVTVQLKYYKDRVAVFDQQLDKFYEDDKVSSVIMLDDLEDKLALYCENYHLAIEEYLSTKQENEELNKSLVDICEDIKELDRENISLVESNNEYFDRIMELEERKELFDEYEYALFYNGKRTDITYDYLKTGCDIMLENGYDPDILFAIVMTESKGQEKAKNPVSTATGFGQLLHSTGKSVYQNYMGNGSGSFSPDLLLDGEANLSIAANYLDQLIQSSNSLTNALAKYRGGVDQPWLNSIDSYMKKGGTSLAQANKEIYGG